MWLCWVSPARWWTGPPLSVDAAFALVSARLPSSPPPPGEARRDSSEQHPHFPPLPDFAPRRRSSVSPWNARISLGCCDPPLAWDVHMGRRSLPCLLVNGMVGQTQKQEETSIGSEGRHNGCGRTLRNNRTCSRSWHRQQEPGSTPLAAVTLEGQGVGCTVSNSGPPVCVC